MPLAFPDHWVPHPPLASLESCLCCSSVLIPGVRHRFTGLAEELFHLLQLLKTLKEHSKKLTYQGDAVAFQLPLLKQRLHEQMVCLLKRYKWRGRNPSAARQNEGREEAWIPQESLTSFCSLSSAFVVEVQPSMPFPCHRPLVLKTSYRFAIRVR